MSHSRNIITLVFLLFVIVVPLQTNAENNKIEKNYNQTEQQKNSPLGSDPKNIAGEDQEKPAEEESPSIWILVSERTDRVIAWIGDGRRTNFFLVVFTALLTVATFWGIRAANAAKKSANVLVSRERAHLMVKVRTTGGPPKLDNNKGPGIWTDACLYNEGSVIAIPTDFFLEATMGLSEPIVCIPENKPIEEVSVGGWKKRERVAFWLNFGPDGVAELEKGATDLTVSGWVRYDDLLGTGHMTYFEWRYRFGHHFHPTKSKKKNRRT